MPFISHWLLLLEDHRQQSVQWLWRWRLRRGDRREFRATRGAQSFASSSNHHLDDRKAFSLRGQSKWEALGTRSKHFRFGQQKAVQWECDQRRTMSNPKHQARATAFRSGEIPLKIFAAATTEMKKPTSHPSSTRNICYVAKHSVM